MAAADQLEAEDIVLLHEIYQVLLVPDRLIFSSLRPSELPFPLTEESATTKTQLLSAIAAINSMTDVGMRTAIVSRIRVFLEEYKNFSNDPSAIDKDGYSFRASDSFQAILRGLYPLIGVVARQGSYDNRIPIG